MQSWLVLIERYSVELLFAVALVAMVYAVARMLSARPSIAFAFAFTPLLMIWVWSNPVSRQFLLAQFA